MKNVKLNIAKEFSSDPGSRYIKLGPNSGEIFYKDFLLIRFQEAIDNRVKLEISLDDVWGFPSSFISESFGKLSKKFGAKVVLSTIVLEGDDLEKHKIIYVIQHPNARSVVH